MANRNPTVSQAITYNTNEDASNYTLDLLQYASDLDANTNFSISNLVLLSGNGTGIKQVGNTLTVNASAYNYLNVNEIAVISYKYKINDGFGGFVFQTAAITIEGRNDGPVVSGELFSKVTEDFSPYSINLLAKASDADKGDILSASPISLSSTEYIQPNDVGISQVGNTLSVNPNAYTYLSAGETKILTYHYFINDNYGGSAAQTLTITITGANDKPVLDVNFANIELNKIESDAPFSINLLEAVSSRPLPPLLSVGLIQHPSLFLLPHRK